jgi:hypothetical protein
MEELIREKCEDYGIDPDILTAEEKTQLQQEIEDEQNGKVVVDSILDSPDIRFRGEE